MTDSSTHKSADEDSNSMDPAHMTEIETLHNIRQEKDPKDRLLKFAALVHKNVVEQEMVDPTEIKTYCSDYGTDTIVGTGDIMDIHTVLRELAEFAEMIQALHLPEHGGDENAIEAISDNNINFQHNAYYALQTFYGKAIYALVIDQMDLFYTEQLLDDPLCLAVYTHFHDSPAQLPASTNTVSNSSENDHISHQPIEKPLNETTSTSYTDLDGFSEREKKEIVTQVGLLIEFHEELYKEAETDNIVIVVGDPPLYNDRLPYDGICTEYNTSLNQRIVSYKPRAYDITKSGSLVLHDGHLGEFDDENTEFSVTVDSTDIVGIWAL